MKRLGKRLLYLLAAICITMLISWILNGGKRDGNTGAGTAQTRKPSSVSVKDGAGTNPTAAPRGDVRPGSPAEEENIRLSRNWQEDMKMPTPAQIEAVSGLGRSPYIAIYPHYPGVSRALQYCVDVRIDHQPKGTYVCPLNWWMDVSSLETRYASVYNDFTGTPGGYCGFQRLNDGSKVFIMTVWSTFCKDYDGNVTVFSPSVIYPENQGEANRTGAEGTFVQYLQPYDWKAGRDYRVLVQQSVSEDTGNTVLSAWVCDLNEGTWRMLVSFDTGVRDVWMRSAAAFLENFLTEYTGEVRTLKLFNLRAFSADTMSWVAADSADFIVNGSVSDLDYIGSCSFGTEGSSIWAITSGVSGLCQTPSDTWTRQLDAGDTGDPLS